MQSLVRNKAEDQFRVQMFSDWFDKKIIETLQTARGAVLVSLRDLLQRRCDCLGQLGGVDLNRTGEKPISRDVPDQQFVFKNGVLNDLNLLRQLLLNLTQAQ